MKIYKEQLKTTWKQDYNFDCIKTEEIEEVLKQWVLLNKNERLIVKEFGKGKAFELIIDHKYLDFYQRCGELKHKYKIEIEKMNETLFQFLTRLYGYDFIGH